MTQSGVTPVPDVTKLPVTSSHRCELSCDMGAMSQVADVTALFRRKWQSAMRLASADCTDARPDDDREVARKLAVLVE